MMDLVSAALACDLTRVATIQWADLAANNSFPWLGLDDTHHGYQHDRGYQPDGISKIDTWYATQFKYFLDQLASPTTARDHWPDWFEPALAPDELEEICALRDGNTA